MSDTHMIMDNRDRISLFNLLRPFSIEAHPHIEGSKLASLAASIHLPISVEYCEKLATEHKAHIDALVEIKRRSQKVRDDFIPQFPLVDINQGDRP